jgi:hypothetical protein
VCLSLVSGGFASDSASFSDKRVSVVNVKQQLFAANYALLALIVVLETAFLRQLLKRVAQLKRFYQGGRAISFRELSGGSLAPEFAGPVLGEDRRVTNSHLRDHETILMFVSPREAFSRSYRHLAIAVHAMWRDVEGHLFLICDGDEGSCRQLASEIRVSEGAVVVDERGEITRRFFIYRTPQALRFDEESRLIRRGSPVVDDIAASQGTTDKTIAKELYVAS